MKYIRVKAGVNVPAGSLAKIGTYDVSGQFFNITKPNADNIDFDQVVIIPSALTADKPGLGYIKGIHVIQKTAGETIVAGDLVGTDTNEWTAIKLDTGPLKVLHTSNSNLAVRPHVQHPEIPDVIVVGWETTTAGYNYAGLDKDLNLALKKINFKRLFGAAVDTDKNVYIGGGGTQVIGFDFYAYFWKWDRYGNSIWAFGFEVNGYVLGVATDLSGNAYAAMNALANFGILYKLSPTGVELAHFSVGAGGQVSTGFCVAADASANIYLGGSVKTGAILQNNSIWKLNASDLTQQWGFQIGPLVGQCTGLIKGIAYDDVGKVFACGQFREDFEEPAVWRTIWIISADGQSLLWYYNTNNILHGIAVNDSSDFVVVGTRVSSTTVWFFKKTGENTWSCAGIDGGWTYDTGDIARGAAFDEDGNVVVVGNKVSNVAIWKLRVSDGVLLASSDFGAVAAYSTAIKFLGDRNS